MEKKDSKFTWNAKNNSLIFGLCLVGVAAFSVLFAMSQVQQAEKEKNQVQLQSEARLNSIVDAEEDDAFVPKVDEAIQNALEEANASDEIIAELEEAAEPVTENAEEESSLEAASAEILPTVTFAETDSLNWPVAGSVVLDYSMDGSIYFPTLQQYKYNPALIIGSDVGAQVVAAAKGIVESIVDDEETGTTITMSLGNGYKLQYGQLKDLSVAEGEVVERGALLGYVSEPTKYYCTEGSNLYFAMTKDETPVDPVLYLE